MLPGPLDPGGPKPRPTRRDDFDALVVAAVRRLSRTWPQLADVEFGTEDVPTLPDDWGEEPVPFGSLVRASGDAPARIVVFRRPVELRAGTPGERAALVLEVLIEHVAELLGRDPAEIDPDTP